MEALDARMEEAPRAAAPSSSDPPLRVRRFGPLHLSLYPPQHPTADVEIAVTLVGVAAFAALLLLPLDSLAAWMPGCRFRELTGWPCATCGITRGVVALGSGDWGVALRSNPLLVAALLAFLAYAVVAAVLWAFRLPRPRIALASRGARLAAGIAAVAAALVNWAILIADGR